MGFSDFLKKQAARDAFPVTVPGDKSGKVYAEDDPEYLRAAARAKDDAELKRQAAKEYVRKKREADFLARADAVELSPEEQAMGSRITSPFAEKPTGGPAMAQAIGQASLGGPKMRGIEDIAATIGKRGTLPAEEQEEQAGPSELDDAERMARLERGLADASEGMSSGLDLMFGHAGGAKSNPNQFAGMRRSADARVEAARHKEKAALSKEEQVRDYILKERAQKNHEQGRQDRLDEAVAGRKHDVTMADKEAAVRKLLAAKRGGSAGEAGVGKTEIKDLRETVRAHTSMNHYIDEMTTAKKSGREFWPWGNQDKVAQQAAATKLILGVKGLAKTGALDEQTERVAMGFVPATGDSEETAKTKLKALRDYIDTEVNAHSGSLGLGDAVRRGGEAPAAAASEEDLVLVQAPNGKRKRIPASAVQAAVAAGGVVIDEAQTKAPQAASSQSGDGTRRLKL